MLRVIKKNKGNEKKKRSKLGKSFCILAAFDFNSTQASSGNTSSQLAADVIVPAEKPLSFHRGCIQIYSLSAVTDHSGDTAPRQ